MKTAAAPPGDLTIYDLVTYPSHAFGQTHPNRLGAVAALHGLPYAPCEQARVLEVGCGDGLNLIALAVAWPQGTFEGFDLAPSAVARGQAMIEALGLTNVRLAALDIRDAAPEPDAFDYVIAHGLYSWIPETVRDALMALIDRALTPSGVAFVSYNALPGGYLRIMARDMLLDGLQGVEDPEERLQRALAMLKSVVEEPGVDDFERTVMRTMCQRFLKYSPEALFHDDLADVFEPVYLKTFAAHAERHGLQFLGEAGLDLVRDGFDDGALSAVAAAQIGDFAAVRNFRQSLLVRAAARPARRLDPQNLRELYVSYRPQEGRSKELATLLDADSALERVHARVQQAWPDHLRLVDIPDAEQALAGLIELCVEGFVRPHAGPAPFAVDLGPKPCASPLVRLEIASGSGLVTTLAPFKLSLPDDVRQFIGLMDGTRSIDELASAAASLFDDGLTIDYRLERLASMALFSRWPIAD